ncbi:DUF1998 domain-containing protein [Clostridium paraputrificum]|uniref:DUF1998 domain-containing protein n=1 Tax=Clostridium paraputrificum TaxID=29363 RepID=UPI00189CA079|nr:DUF1998 domain-containing protein [Clostridium paraputrificum]MDB2091855.1 DUF1998 domain-containing protein [Clostridium paraputrificum]
MLKEHHVLYKTARASSVITPFGVGAIMDLPEGTFMTVTCDKWDKKKLTTIHDERLEKILKVKEFKSPIVKKNNEDNNIYIPLVQFPSWMFCPKCRKFKPISEWQSEYKKKKKQMKDMTRLKCTECNVKLSPSRIVIACENGHIDDFPWIQWVHYKNKKKICRHPDIYIKTIGSSSGLEGIQVECRTCNIKSSLAGAFDKNQKVFEKLEDWAVKEGIYEKKYSLKCSGNRPWDGSKDKKCRVYPKTLQRGATNIYFPKIESSLLIPPYTEKINRKIEDSEGYEKLLVFLETAQEVDITEDKVKSTIELRCENIADEQGIPLEIVKKIIYRKLKNIDDGLIESRTRYKEEEYRALIGDYGYDEIQDQVDFKIEAVDGVEYNKEFIDKVVLIHKMKEIRVMSGFSRINSPDFNIMELDEDEESGTIIRPLKDKNWYPALEVRGEGVFIKLNEDLINSWISSCEDISNRSDLINKRYNEILAERGHTQRKISSKFLLLHTLSHLIIKELSFKCGYSSTSLRERIYCDDSDDGLVMSGILIYTANGDSEGTLGGLVRQGKSDKFNEIIDSAIKKARFCSSDPVCGESRGQGRDALNMSACYSCTLVSETSCEEFNTLLDRAMIVGTLDNEEIGFFNYLNNKK